MELRASNCSGFFYVLLVYMYAKPYIFAVHLFSSLCIYLPFKPIFFPILLMGVLAIPFIAVKSSKELYMRIMCQICLALWLFNGFVADGSRFSTLALLVIFFLPPFSLFYCFDTLILLLYCLEINY